MFYVCDQCRWMTEGGKSPSECPQCQYGSFSAFADGDEAVAAAEFNAGFDRAIDELDRGERGASWHGRPVLHD